MTALSRYFAVSNLDFENELAAGAGYRPQELLRQVNERWRYILRLLPGASNAECQDTEVDAPAGLLPWGVTPSIAERARALGFQGHFPEVDVVREINDKRYSHSLEQKLGVALDYSRVVADLEELAIAVKACPHDWVLKHPLGFSARERMVGKAGVISDSAWGWARRKFQNGWTLLFEPWVEQRQDFSLHFEISRLGQVSHLGRCELVSDPGGVYRGNRVLPGLPPLTAALEVATMAAREVAGQGYWGPLGIDAFAGVLAGQPVIRPLVEINGRYSFGRLTLGLGQWLPPTWSYLWWHPSQAEAWRVSSDLAPLPALGEPPPGAGIYGLPLVVDPRRVCGTAVVIAENAQELRELERRLFEADPPPA